MWIINYRNVSSVFIFQSYRGDGLSYYGHITVLSIKVNQTTVFVFHKFTRHTALLGFIAGIRGAAPPKWTTFFPTESLLQLAALY